MKYRIIISVLTLFVVALALPVFAKEGADDNRAASMTERREDREGEREDREKEIEQHRASSTERRVEIRNNIEQRKASSTERRVEMQTNLAKRKVEHVTKIILATIERLEKIITRIESRIVKIQERGGDTTEAEGFVALAKENLADAKVAVEVFATLDLSGSTARENFETIRAAAAEAQELIRTAHRNLMMAVRALKGPNTGLEGERRATSTSDSDSDD